MKFLHKLFGILHGRFLFPFSYLYQYVCNHANCFIRLTFNTILFEFVAQIVVAWELFQLTSLTYLHQCVSCFALNTPLLSGSATYHKHILYILWPSPITSHLSRKPWSIYWRILLKIKKRYHLFSLLLRCHWLLNLSSDKEMYLCKPNCVCTHNYIYIHL